MPATASCRRVTSKPEPHPVAGASPRCAALALLLLQLGAGGCYRSVEVSPGEVKRVELDGRRGSATLRYANGDVRRVNDYDSFTVRSNRVPLRSTLPEAAFDTEQRVYVFESPAYASLRPTELVVSDGRSHYAFATRSVVAMKLEKHSPQRPWLIVGSALVFGAIAGIVGYSAGGSCPEDGGDSGCFANLAAATVAVPVGVAVGILIGIPLTGRLGTTERRQPATEKQSPRPER